MLRDVALQHNCVIMRVLCYGTLRGIVWYLAAHNDGAVRVASLSSRTATHCVGTITRCRMAITRCVFIEGVACSNTDLCLKHHSQIDLCKNGQNCFKRIGGVRSFGCTLIFIVDNLQFGAYYLRQ